MRSAKTFMRRSLLTMLGLMSWLSMTSWRRAASLGSRRMERESQNWLLIKRHSTQSTIQPAGRVVLNKFSKSNKMEAKLINKHASWQIEILVEWNTCRRNKLIDLKDFKGAIESLTTRTFTITHLSWKRIISWKRRKITHSMIRWKLIIPKWYLKTTQQVSSYGGN